MTSTARIPYISEHRLLSNLGSQSKNYLQPQSYECTVSLMCECGCGDRDKNELFLKKVFGPKPENTLEMWMSTITPILEMKRSEMLRSGAENR